MEPAGCQDAPVTTPPHPGTREYRSQVVRISDLTVTTDLLEDLTFENCVVTGPAVLGLLEEVTIANCNFDAPDANALFWPVPDSRPIVMGIVAVRRVGFFSCRFERIGLAAPEAALPELQRGFNI